MAADGTNRLTDEEIALLIARDEYEYLMHLANDDPGVFAEHRAVKEAELGREHEFVRSMRKLLALPRRFPNSDTPTAAIRAAAEQYGLGKAST